jgi:thiol-disulfide isomerase/thioredoxin
MVDDTNSLISVVCTCVCLRLSPPLSVSVSVSVSVSLSCHTHTAHIHSVCIYFSGHWCEPCKVFTPFLIDWYTKLTSEGKKIEVIYVSSDKDIEEYHHAIEQMPWLCLPFDDPRRQKLSKKFRVTLIPWLTVLTGDARVSVHMYS